MSSLSRSKTRNGPHKDTAIHKSSHTHISNKPLAAAPSPLAVSRRPFKRSDYGPCEPGRIPGVSEGLTTSKSPSEPSSRLACLSLCLTQTFTQIKLQKPVGRTEGGNVESVKTLFCPCLLLHAVN